MNQIKLFSATTLCAACFVITNSCSQAIKTETPSVLSTFQASTPCDETAKVLLHIPADTKCEWMKWKLTLYTDSKNSVPSAYKLIYEYGMAKQGTRNFAPGSKIMELKGTCSVIQGLDSNKNAIIYKLTDPDLHITLSFLKLDQNVLHLMDEKDNLMVGTGAWSYTLNRINPVKESAVNFTSQKIKELSSTTDSTIIGIFDGRTPCISVPRELLGISALGCQIMKWRLTLNQDPETHMPSTFQIFTVYVGKGNSRYTNSGVWRISKGLKNDPESIIYELVFDSDKHETLKFLKGDDNILFFVDEDTNFMVGDDYTSFTLNRINNKDYK